MLTLLAIGWAQAAPVRLAVVVTSNVGLEDEAPLLYADDDGQRFAEVLTELGGVEQDDVFVASDAGVDELTEALGRATVRASALRDSGDEVVLVLYYAGHAGADGLHLHGERLSLSELKTAARVVPAVERIFTVDSCQSGQLFRSRGASLTQLPGGDVDFQPPPEEAWLTSSGAEERSFEVDKRRGALFTHFLVSGLRGGADDNGDQQVTLGELYGFVRPHTEAAAAQLGYLQQPQWAGSDLEDLVLTDLSRAGGGIDIAGPVSEPLLVVDRQRAAVAAEIPAGAGGRLALPAGRYQLLAMSGLRPRAADIVVGSTGFRTVTPAQLHEVRGVRSRGGLVVERPFHLAAGYRGGLAASAAAGATHGAWLSGGRALGHGHHLMLRGGWSTGQFVHTWAEGRERTWTTHLDWTWDAIWRKYRAGPGVRVGGGVLEQVSNRRQDTRWGAWYGDADASSSGRFPIGDVRGLWSVVLPAGPLELRATAAAGATAILADATTWRPSADVHLGVGARL